MTEEPIIKESIAVEQIIYNCKECGKIIERCQRCGDALFKYYCIYCIGDGTNQSHYCFDCGDEMKEEER